MRWWHTHKWKLVGTTYAPPAGIKSVGEGTIEGLYAIRPLLVGQTTFVWKCEDPECDAIRKEECLGKELK